MRILIAEDDPVIALGLARRVAQLGHEPIGPVHDGLEALAAARADTPDLYLFDIDMPRLDGLAAAKALSSQGLRRTVVVITGVQDPGLIDRSITSGVSAYLSKPINDLELDATIRLAHARHEESLALEAEVDRAHQALEDRKLVERAKGMLIDALGLGEAEAFARIQRAARNRNLRLADIAREIVQQADIIQPLDSSSASSASARPTARHASSAGNAPDRSTGLSS
jgi:AmiR/NasT family two-component response regulator